MRALILAAALLAIPAAARAQAPVVTSAGDPSVDADTIYALAVDPADHPEESVILLLDDGIVIQNADGTGSDTYRQVVQVLTRDAVEGQAEHSWTYDAVRERFRLNWARVVRPDGTVISDGPLLEQTSDVPASQESPVYTETKRVRVSLGGVEPGTIVDVSWTTEVVEPIMPRDFRSFWSITTGSTVRRSRLLVDVPVDYPLRVRERNVTRPARVRESNGRKVTEWTAADLERMEPESFVSALETTLFESIQLGGPLTWGDIGGWYAEQARERYVLDDAVRAAARAAAGGGSDRERLEALHKWIAQDIRYISIALGDGGYQPRFPAEVIGTLSGDCKDKATLFILLARELGFEAHPVLLNSNGGDRDDPPTVGAFDHVIAAVRLDGGWTYVDLTAGLVPFGRIPPSYQGHFGLIVFDDGAVEEIEFPEPVPGENWNRLRLEGELTADGGFTGTFVTSAGGFPEYQFRDLFASPPTERELGQFASALAGRLLRGARGQNVQAFDGLDLGAPVRVSVDVSADRVLQSSGEAFLLTLPPWSLANRQIVVVLEEQLGRRRHPIDVDQVVARATVLHELAITLPEGWTVRLPPSFEVDEVWGTYRVAYRQEGRLFTMSREVYGKTGSQPKEALPDLIAFFNRINEDDVSVVTLTPGS